LSLDGELALITGGAQGIGLATAQALAREGCNLIICGRNLARLKRAQRALSTGNGKVLALVCDVRDERSVKRMFGAVSRKFKSLDILINSAGIAHRFKPTGEVTAKEWTDVLATNLTGTFLMTKAALPLMKRGAAIVNVLSMSSKRVFPNLSAYNASKFGAPGLTNTLREELRQAGIRVIAVLPGSTDTPYLEHPLAGCTAAQDDQA
jgi:NAD(P)-dependent dehydrogenase (short-subunit alcohol dehydrogenase family)